jgi:thiamine biosynthesis protein ThiS
MRIHVNGQTQEVPGSLTVRALLDFLKLDPARVAIELDGAILKRPEWPARVLSPGARVEIVHFVGGG